MKTTNTSRKNEKVGVLIVDHGSRVESANDALTLLARSVSDSKLYGSVRHAHMELASPTIGDAFDQLAADGMAHIIVVPYFLALGRHASEDIPRMCDAAARRHPNICWRLAAPVGTSPQMPAIVTERVDAALTVD